MRMTVLALAVAGAFAGGAHAQSATLTGVIDGWVGSLQYSGDKRKAVTNSGGMTTSWWGVEGSEDLGDGLKAEFSIAGYIRNDTGESGRFNGNESYFSRSSYVGLKGRFGTVHLGRDGAPNFLPALLFNSFGGSFAFSPLILHTNVPLFNGTGWQSVNAGDTAWSNQVRYTTPNLGGFTGNLHYQFGEVTGDNSKRNVGASFLYFNGPFGVGGFVHDVRSNNPNPGTIGNVKLGFARQKAWMLSGRAKFGDSTVYANFEQATNDNYAGPPGQAESKTWGLSADHTIGGGKLLAAFASTRWTTSPTSARDGSKRETLSVGYDYFLSKRTDMYAVLMTDKITTFDRGDTVAVGIRHRF
ncbi:MAG: porin [Burkholderiaceae bacterium]|nr:porin [Burkholderiaceae bacterium]